MKKSIIRISSILLVIVMLLSISVTVFANDGKNKMNRFNVVFVTDTSGSMSNTDPDNYRFESIELFVRLLANGGNNVGSIVFSNGVVSKHDMINVNGKAEKDSISSQIRKEAPNGWTDIGSGLMTAVDMLKSKGDPSLPSIIILLTDGNTEMGTSEKTQESIAKKEEALEQARNNGIQIYSISLNKNKTANSNELKQIATATGGQFQEVTNASDLQSVFDLFYQMIYSTQSVKLVDETVPSSGTISRDFDVADLGVEEVNVVIFGDVKNCKLKKPSGTELSQKEIDDILFKSKTFSIIKIPSPEKGVWNLTVEAAPNSTIKIFKIYNSNLKVDASIINQKDSYILNEPINFICKIKENDTLVTDLSRYSGYKAVLSVKDYSGKEIHKEETNSVSSNGFSLNFTPKDYGTYYATISVETKELFAEAPTFTLNVGNTPPVPVSDVVKRHINRWPFLIKTNSTINLSETATDAEDKALQYRVKSSTWLEEDYTLNGDKLTIDKFSVSKGSFTIEAYDSKGAFCTYEIKVTSTNIGLWAVILILGGGLLVLIALAIITYRSLGIPFMGSFTVENISSGQTATTQKSRGRLKLSAFQIGQTGIDKNSYFQATGKNYVYFKTSKPVYADNMFKKTKKVKIETSMEVKISSNQEYENGIIVRFESMLNNYDMY